MSTLKGQLSSEETAMVKGQILNDDPTLGQYGVFLPSDLSMTNDKDVKFLA